MGSSRKWHITKVNFEYMNSSFIEENDLLAYLVGAECSWPGILKLELKQNKILKQEGPYICPPIRWLDSFGSADEFRIVCHVE